jgi:hypothetical protein
MRWVLLCLLAGCQLVFQLDPPIVADATLDGAADDAGGRACWDVAATANHDNDTFVDGCDPCPAIVDAEPIADEDLDLVGDACDPEPQTPGNRILAFDGLDTAIAWQASTGDWIASNGGYTQSNAALVKSETTRSVVPARRPGVDVQYGIIANDDTSSSSVFVQLASNTRVVCKKRTGNGPDFLELVIANAVVDMVEIVSTDQPIRLTLWQSEDSSFHCRYRQGLMDVTTNGLVVGQPETFDQIGLALEETSARFDAVTVFAQAE